MEKKFCKRLIYVYFRLKIFYLLFITIHICHNKHLKKNETWKMLTWFSESEARKKLFKIGFQMKPL